MHEPEKLTTEVPTPGPTQESTQQRTQRLNKERIAKERQMIILNFTLSVLSHFENDHMNMLTRSSKDYNSSFSMPGIASFYTIIGVDIKEDDRTKDRKTREILAQEFAITVNRLWEPTPDHTEQDEERQIMKKLEGLKQNGTTKQQLFDALNKRFGIESPDNP